MRFVLADEEMIAEGDLAASHAEPVTARSAPDDPSASGTHADAPTVRLAADVSSAWSWASSVARIPQVTDLTIELPLPIQHAVITASVSDGDITFGQRVVHDGPLGDGLKVFPSVHVPLAARRMAGVYERLNVECSITLEDIDNGQILARHVESIDLQPKDLWLWAGDPHRAEQRRRLEVRYQDLTALLETGTDHDDAAQLAAERRALDGVLRESRQSSWRLARSLLASFVRPNHPAIAEIAREAAEILGQRTGDSGFFAFQQRDPAAVSARADATVDAIYEALVRRRIAYSEPPPGWDYFDEGQRIREHGEVANGGLGTCMDTTVLFGAVLEHVGIPPVLVTMHGHILIGYWRQDPFPDAPTHPAWHPNTPIVDDASAVSAQRSGSWLGLIETTAFTTGSTLPSERARAAARSRIADGSQQGPVVLIDVAVARREGVSPLPAVRERDDGVTEVIEYRGTAAPRVEELDSETTRHDRHKPVDNHPARYRTWKASLFSMGATNALLNLGSSARVQPLVVPPEALGTLEDRLQQDDSFTLLSGYEIPDVWEARDRVNAMQMLEDEQDRQELIAQLLARRLFVQRIGRSRGEIKALPQATFYRELRSMAHQAKVAREERGMNPLFLCIGMLRWQYKPGAWADAPLILIPVDIRAVRGRSELTLSLDASQHTTPNAALIEWLRREHDLVVPGLVEPLADRAGIDVDQVLKDVRIAIAERGLPFQVVAEAKVATLDLSAFRMWQDLELHGELFLKQSLVRHLALTPAEEFIDPKLESLTGEDQVSTADELDLMETPIESDAEQRRAVLWARQGRTFVLQGPPGTGKTQTITNMVAECLGNGQRVLFVAEKGTALSEVQKRLEQIGLSPFSLNLHHESSNVTEVRAQLRRSLDVRADADPVAVASARRGFRAARHELVEYSSRLHSDNAAGLSAYAARDQLLVLGDGPAVPVPSELVAHHSEAVAAVSEVFESLQRWASGAGVRARHPWRLAGGIAADDFDVQEIGAAIRAVLDGAAWAATAREPLGTAFGAVTHPKHLRLLADAASLRLPAGPDLYEVLSECWRTGAPDAVASWERRAAEVAATGLHGFAPDVLMIDLRSALDQWEMATASGMFGRSKRQIAALAPLAPFASSPNALERARSGVVLPALIEVQQLVVSARTAIAAIPGLSHVAPANILRPGAFAPLHQRLDALIADTADLRHSDWSDRISELARTVALDPNLGALQTFSSAWERLFDVLNVAEDDFEAWRDGRTMLESVRDVRVEWTKQLEHERLLPLQRWSALVHKLEPTRTAGMLSARADILEGRLTAWAAADALSRGIATSSLDERMRTTGLDRFDGLAHEERVDAFLTSDASLRQLWRTSGPSRMLEQRAAASKRGSGGLARELEKTSRRLSTRAVLKKFGEVVQDLTPLVLASPASVVDLIDPRVMGFDIVIFDEASQITVPEAIGALGRAASAIVVGDRHQMPPSRRVGSQHSPDEEIDDPAVLEIVEDQESILSEADLARVPSMTLSWHYRSQDESLIDFSNRTYYRGRLSSFPTPTLHSQETGVELRRVDDGHYLRAGSASVEIDGVVAGINTNPAEAQAIVREVHALAMQSTELPSIGIITFNEQQRELIETLLAHSTDARVIAMQDAAVMGSRRVLFVKALEQVQGDERDTILFSVAFSSQGPRAKVPTNFGPLSNQGGERRLNVAITRAKRKNMLFCSFDLHQLDVSGSMYDGPKDLKAFLEFAQEQTQRRSDTDAHSAAPSKASALYRDRHRDDIAAALEEAGLHVSTDVGMSAFRVDLILSRLEAPNRPILPVFLDGESWRRRATTSDRDVLPVSVMQNLMGWPVVARIWWPMWLQNREHVIARILAEVESAERMMATLVPGHNPFSPDVNPLVEGLQAAAQSAEPGAESSQSPPSVPAESVSLAADANLATEQPEHTVPAAVRQPSTAEGDSIVGRAKEPAQSTDDHVPERTDFIAASVAAVGNREVLDALGNRNADRQVRDQVLDVIQAEGPIELQRLARIVGRRFGLSTVRASRVAAIVRLVPRVQVKRHVGLGDFAWPEGIDPDDYTDFRPAVGEAVRAIHEIAPEELANAMRVAAMAGRGKTGEEAVLRDVAQQFGFSKLGAQVRSRLSLVWTRFGPFGETASPELPSDSHETTRSSGLIGDLTAMFEQSMRDGQLGAVNLRNAYVQWAPHGDSGLVFEVGDGGDYREPMDAALVDALVSRGWRRPTPERRNCWVVFAAMPGEPAHRRTARLEACAEIVEGAVSVLTGADEG